MLVDGSTQLIKHNKSFLIKICFDDKAIFIFLITAIHYNWGLNRKAFMFRPLLALWVQPFVVIASMEAVNGFNLLKPIHTAILALKTQEPKMLAVFAMENLPIRYCDACFARAKKTMALGEIFSEPMWSYRKYFCIFRTLLMRLNVLDINHLTRKWFKYLMPHMVKISYC